MPRHFHRHPVAPVLLGWVSLLLAGLTMLSPWAVAEIRPDLEKARTWWAFQPLRREIPVPAVAKHAGWPRNEIDSFLLAKWESENRPPPAASDPRSLIRRLFFTLTGLPPTDADVEAFSAEAQKDLRGAMQRWTARLLASPRYGEAQARHWLDVARYSDTKGYVYGREERFFVHSHPYRDWVIRSFNEDLPYDQFLRLQIAADQLVAPHSSDLAGMGFLTLGRRFLGVTHDIIDDRIDVVTRGAMALTVQCARCHDHKYDPITARDYYALYGVFRACNERLERLEKPAGTPAASASASLQPEMAAKQKQLDDAMRSRRDECGGRLRSRLADYLMAQTELEKYPEEGFDEILGPEELNPASVRRWRDYLHAASAAPDGRIDSIFAPWLALCGLPPAEFRALAGPALEKLFSEHRGQINEKIAEAFAIAPESLAHAARRYAEVFRTAAEQSLPECDPASRQLADFLCSADYPACVPDVGIVNNEAFFMNSVREELWKLQGELDRWLINTPQAPPCAVVLTDRPGDPLPRVFNRGNPAQPGEEVPRRFLAFLTGGAETPFRGGSGRLELAEAVASPDNPLTARVMVNRIWQQHFGTGLVKTSSDFGLRGEPPAHPDLLDWLARRFIASGWSVKAMHRLIVDSAFWQSAGTERRRRLSFEEMRDAMLAATGELDVSAAGGRPEDSLAENSKRRTIYGLVDRQYLPSSFSVFDFPHPDVHAPARHETLIAQQALFFLNSPFVARRAKALAARAAASDAAPPQRVQLLHRWLYQRPATAAEIEAAWTFTAAAAESPDAQPDAPPPEKRLTPWEQYAQVLLLANEFLHLD